MKAGLLENLAQLRGHGKIHFVELRRDPVEILASFAVRQDFVHRSSMWLWYLDPAYPRKIVDPTSLIRFGVTGIRLWYVFEILARAAYYRELFADDPDVQFHTFSTKDLKPA